MSNLLLEMQGIAKYFPGVIANDDVNLKLHEGEVLALLGENGAGKTTLMNILYGIYKPDKGKILVDGQEVSIGSPSDSRKYRIGMIHQHFMLVDVHTVVENIILGLKPQQGRTLSIAESAKKIQEIGKKYRLDVDPYAYIYQLPVGLQQRVEIIKAIFVGAKILIMDEPTAVLTPQEANELFEFARNFKKQGNSIIFITHKLGEVMAIADRIEVLRDGRVVGEVQKEDAAEDGLAQMMVGRKVVLDKKPEPTKMGPTILNVKNLSVKGDRGNVALDKTSFEIKAGEIFGVAGVSGNGQEELAQTIYGLRKAVSGSIKVNGQEIVNKSPLFSMNHGVAYIPEDRQKTGLVLGMSVQENLMLKSYCKPPFSRDGVLNLDKMAETSRKLVEEDSIKTPSISTKVKNLSGGNQQKIVISREIQEEPSLLIAAQPTRGLDIGAAEYVHKTFFQERSKGKAILLISTDLNEILSLSDTIGVLYGGKLLKIMPREDADIQKIGLLMAGIREE
jgi:ABC-type uncharacterized transport system ATPase subunit